MHKKIALITFLSLSAATFGQNDPTIDAVYLDGTNNFCTDGSYKNLVIEVTDLDGDVVNIDNITFSNGYLEYLAGPAPVTVGNTTTFTYYVQVSGTTPPGVGAIVSESITVYASAVTSFDPVGTDSDVLSGLVVNGPVYVDVTTTNLGVCQNGLPFDISGYGLPAGGTFSWGETWAFSNPTWSNSTAFDPKKAYKYFADDGFDMYYISYTVTNVNNCKNDAFIDVYFMSPPDVFTSITPSACGSATGSATVVLSGTSPYNVNWTTGFSETGVASSSTISNLASGVYYANITDANGCKSTAKLPVGDADVLVTNVITPSRCAGQTGLVDLTVTPSIGAVSSVFWSNGTETTDLAAAPGEYSVAIHTTANCNYYGTYIIPDSALKVKLEYTGPNSNCLSSPNGYFDITTSGGNGPYNWDWKRNGTSLYTTEDISNIDGGVYSCTVVDNNSCSLTWNKTLENYNNVWLYVNELVKPTCGNADGMIDIYINPTFDIPTVYSWSNGMLTEDLSNVPAGTYTLTYADQGGCENYLTVKLENEKPYQPAICLLTVDTTLIYNEVIWEKDISQPVAGFHIYRETSVYGQFERVATRPYALESFYQDNAASPVDRSWRYYMTTYDACGGESYGSFIHKTIHVVATTSDGTNYDLHWDDYEGISYTSIDLHRFDASNGWTTIGPNLPYGTNTYADAPPVLTGLDYLVTFNLADPCTSSKVQDHNSSRSNKSASVFMPGGSTAQIQDVDLGYVSIYPNPAHESVMLHVDNPELFQNYEIRDLNGQLVQSGIIFTNNTSIEVDGLAPGLYVIQLYADNKQIVTKFIKD